MRTVARGLVCFTACATLLVACQGFLDFGEKKVVVYVGADGAADGALSSDAADAGNDAVAEPACKSADCEQLLSADGLFGVAVDDKRIYLSRYENNDVWALPIDKPHAAPVVSQTIEKPAHLAVNAIALYVGTDNGSLSRVFVLDPNDAKEPMRFVSTVNCNGACLGVSLGTNGSLYYTRRSSSVGEGAFVGPGTTTTTAPAIQAPEGIAVAANGDVYVASVTNDSLLFFTVGTSTPSAKVSIKAPAGVAVDATSWWVASQDPSGAIWRGSLGDAGAQQFVAAARPTGIAVTTTAIYFVTRPSNGRPTLWRVKR